MRYKIRSGHRVNGGGAFVLAKDVADALRRVQSMIASGASNIQVFDMDDRLVEWDELERASREG